MVLKRGKTGSTNRRRGATFETQCEKAITDLGILAKRVTRPNIYVSYYDIELPEYGIGLDCKFTFNSFTQTEKLRLYKTVKKKYGNKVLVVIGERRAKVRLSFDNDVKILIPTRYGLGEVAFRSYLLSLIERRN